jgi:hypothetical protein
MNFKRILGILNYIPFIIVSRLSQRSNIDQDKNYTLFYSGTIFFIFVTMVVLSILAYRADYRVWYSMTYDTSGSIARSVFEAIAVATLIQIFLFNNLGSFLGALINGFAWDKRHIPMTIINLLLGGLGLFATIFLSLKTYHIADVSSETREQNIESKYDAKYKDLASWKKSQLDSLKSEYNAEVAQLAKIYEPKIEAAKGIYGVSIKKWKARWQQGSVSQQEYNNAISHLQTKISTKTNAPSLLTEFSDQKAIALSSYNDDKDKVTEEYNALYAKIEVKEKEDDSDVKNDKRDYSASTRFKNIAFNGANIILLLGVLFYFRERNKGHEKREVPDDIIEYSTNGVMRLKNALYSGIFNGNIDANKLTGSNTNNSNNHANGLIDLDLNDSIESANGNIDGIPIFEDENIDDLDLISNNPINIEENEKEENTQHRYTRRTKKKNVQIENLPDSMSNLLHFDLNNINQKVKSVRLSNPDARILFKDDKVLVQFTYAIRENEELYGGLLKEGVVSYSEIGDLMIDHNNTFHIVADQPKKITDFKWSDLTTRLRIELNRMEQNDGKPNCLKYAHKARVFMARMALIKAASELFQTTKN